MKNRATAEVTLKDILDKHKEEIFLEMNCHAIGVVEKFNEDDQTCMVKINYLKSQLVRNAKGIYETVSYEYPILLDCPTIFHTGATSGFTNPVKKGDSCVVLFNDRDIDNWFSGANSTEVASNRIHSISDGIVLIGARNKANPIEGFDNENPHIWNGDTRIKVKTDKVLIENSSDQLGALMRELVDAVKAIVTTNTADTVNPASQAAIEAVAVKIEGLLE